MSEPFTHPCPVCGDVYEMFHGEVCSEKCDALQRNPYTPTMAELQNAYVLARRDKIRAGVRGPQDLTEFSKEFDRAILREVTAHRAEVRAETFEAVALAGEWEKGDEEFGDPTTVTLDLAVFDALRGSQEVDWVRLTADEFASYMSSVGVEHEVNHARRELLLWLDARINAEELDMAAEAFGIEIEWARGGVAVPVEPDERLDAWESIARHPFFDECYSADSPLLAAMLGKLASRMPSDSERFPESSHVEAKYWAELVRARRQIAELEAVEPSMTGQIVTASFEDGQGSELCGLEDCECPQHEYAPRPKGTYITVRLDSDPSIGLWQVTVTPVEPVQVDPQPHDSGSCPNGGGYSCTNHEPQTPTQVTEGGTQ